MRRVVLALGVVLGVMACDQERGQEEVVVSEKDVVVRAVEGDADAIAELRAEGRDGLARLLAARRDHGDADWNRAIDAVAGQHDAALSGLFWETDLEHARANAKVRGVPVLSLRMLGDLREELSCANSRFFRTLLYSDPELARFLDASFVLHWSSERPVPKVTIDFGDGRTITTTTTGNSAHYVLDDEGRVLDVLPGLYDPASFRAKLQETLALHDAIERAPRERDALVREHHARAAAAIEGAWAGRHPLLASWMMRAPGRTDDAPVPALDAQPIAVSKMRVETPTLRRVTPTPAPAIAEPPRALLESLAGAVQLTPEAIAIVKRDRPIRSDETAEQYDERIGAVLKTTATDLAVDAFVNETRLHFQIHRWFANGEVDGDFEPLDERVYRELFGTPRSDPWLGLRDEAVYDGLREPAARVRG